MMKSTKILFLAIAAIIVLNSCQQSVRFASQGKSISTNTEKQNTKTHKPQKVFTGQSEEILAKEVDKWLGTPYQYGGTSKSGIDCSAFVQNVYSELGVSLPRTSAQQFSASVLVNEKQRMTGDLIFFSDAGRVNHVGIFFDDGTMAHASSSRGVVVEELSGKIYRRYFAHRYAGTGRVL